MCPGITWGISLKCKCWFRESTVGQDPAFLTCSQWVLRLRAHGPHVQKEVFTGFPLKVPQRLEELPIVVPSSIAYLIGFPSFPVSPPLSGFLYDHLPSKPPKGLHQSSCSDLALGNTHNRIPLYRSPSLMQVTGLLQSESDPQALCPICHRLSAIRDCFQF